jgi:hypothetical protein
VLQHMTAMGIFFKGSGDERRPQGEFNAQSLALFPGRSGIGRLRHRIVAD